MRHWFEALESRMALSSDAPGGAEPPMAFFDAAFTPAASPSDAYSEDAYSQEAYSREVSVQASLAPMELPRRVNTWAVIGPFIPTSGDGFHVDFLQSTYVESDAYAYLGQTVFGKTWEYMDDRTFSRNLDDYIDLYAYYGLQQGLPTARRVAYAGAWVFAPVSGPYRVHFGQNDRAKLWIDGNLLISDDSAGQAQREDHRVDVILGQGWHRVLIKVVNVRRTWGFYFNLTHTDDSRVADVEFAPHDPGPGDPLVVLTRALPDGYQDQPYVWLSVQDTVNRFPEDNPSASPFRFVGRGGTAPYSYHLHSGELPPGLGLDAAEGEILGKPSDIGSYQFAIRMEDRVGSPVAIKEFELRIRPRPTMWLEEGNRLGGLRHGAGKFDWPTQQAQLAARQGYDWIAPTDFGWSMNSPDQIVINAAPTIHAWAKALRSAGVEPGVYQNLGDPWYRPIGNRPGTPLEYAEALHDAVEKWARRVRPALWWFDGWAYRVIDRLRPPNLPTYEFDALFSLIKSLDPNAVVLVNSAEQRGQAAELGDIDLVSFEGSNSGNNYWAHWPSSTALADVSPKHLPLESWRYIDSGGNDDWRQWLRVLIAMLAEPDNDKALRLLDLDTSWELHDFRYQVHRQIADWLDPMGNGERRRTILGTRPYSLRNENWGYDVIDPDTGNVYLHFTANSRGKDGAFGSAFAIGPIDFQIERVSTVPDGTDLCFQQVGDSLIVDMSRVVADPVSTILQLSPRRAPSAATEGALAAEDAVWSSAVAFGPSHVDRALEQSLGKDTDAWAAAARWFAFETSSDSPRTAATFRPGARPYVKSRRTLLA